ncbi:hypothetical protein MKEN_01469300 [Mycena kentingensis (nom. inval.)]|nr:hypothetical protein MKEN_01469300 [Mycena kentingensis (nom. inval.)]
MSTVWIAQELVDLIVSNITDNASLKSCALAAHRFRAGCQKRLFAKLQLRVASNATQNGDDTSVAFTTALRHFNDHQHLAGYVVDLTVHLLAPDAQEIPAVLLVLGRLNDVTELCIGHFGALIAWDTLPSICTSSILQWLETRRLRKLALHHIDKIGAHEFWTFLRSSEDQLYVACGLAQSTSTLSGPVPEAIKALSLVVSPSMADALCQTGLRSMLQRLETLIFSDVGRPEGWELLSLLAPTLPRLSLVLMSVTAIPLPTPPRFPELTWVLMTFGTRQWESDDDPRTLPMLRILTDSRAPKLEEVAFQMCSTVGTDSASGSPMYSFSSKLLVMLDELLAQHRTIRDVAFRLRCRFEDPEATRAQAAAAHLSAFSATISAGFPKTAAAKRVIIALL